MDLEMCLLEGKPIVSNDDVLAGSKAKVEKWERSSSLSMMIIKSIISETIYGGFPSCDNAKIFLRLLDRKNFLEAIARKFRELYKAGMYSFYTGLYDNNRVV